MGTKQILLGNEAVARGAYEAGVKVVSSYPGTPSTEITEAAAGYERIRCEWAVNEKVGLEVAVGASIGGARAMTCMKHVGVNVAADPLFTASYVGVNGGLVVVAADDPGMHSSQNEQDSRHYARAAKLAMFEPSDSQESRDFTRAAFALSERFDMPVMIRLTTRIAHSRSLVELDEPQPQTVRPYGKDVAKYVMMPAMAINRHRIVEQRQNELAAASDADDSIGLHQEIWRSDELGIITSGIAYQYVSEAFPEASVLKLGLIYPLPLGRIRQFAAKVRRLIVVEELDPFLETEIRAAGVASATGSPCEGKSLFTLLGEYSVAMLRQALGLPGLGDAALSRGELTAAPGRPPVMCAGCPHKGLFLALKRLKTIVSGDIGCYTLGALSPTEAMDTCLCMGASIGMAHGLDKASDGELSKRTVAVIGDSTFIHSGITNLINCVYNQSDTTILILDNSITGMTGHQQNPATGKNIRLQDAPALDLEALCRAVGVRSIRVLDPADTNLAEQVIAEEMARPGVSVVIARRPCALIPSGRGRPENAVRVDLTQCRRCKACLRIMCPALVAGPEGYPVVDAASCTACGLCLRMCKFGALQKGGQAE
jgi:indolepyruvate ferredoxin oxidoreductase, alpha subunit